MATLGVVVISLTGMKYLTQCVESARWADAVLVLHVGEGEPAFGGEQLSSSISLRRVDSVEEATRADEEKLGMDWVLRLWGEEKIEPRLQEELETIRRAAKPDIPDGFRIPIRSRVLGHWANGSLWGPSPALRLSRKGSRTLPTWWNMPAEESQEAVGLLGGAISDYASAELSSGFERIQSVSGHWAEQFHPGNDNPGAGRISCKTFETFAQVLIVNRFYGQGLSGLTLSVLAAYGTLLSGAKAWEARHVKEKR